MIHPLGTILLAKWSYDGTRTASTAPTLYVNGSSSALTVTFTTSTAGILSASVATSSLANGDRLEFKGGSVTTSTGGPWPLESSVYVLDATIASRLAPATAGRTLQVGTGGGVQADVATIAGSADAALGLQVLGSQIPYDSSGLQIAVGLVTMGQQYSDLGFINVNVDHIGGETINFVGSDLPPDRIARLDYLTGNVATAAALTAVQNALNALANMTDTSLAVPGQLVVPSAGTRLYKIRAVFTDSDNGNALTDMDSTALTLTNPAGTSRASRLSAATRLSLGVYEWVYTSTAGDVEEGLIFDITGTKAGNGVWRNASASQTINSAIIDFDTTDRARLNAMYNALPAGGAAIAKAGDAMTLTSAYDAAKAAASQTSVNAIPTNPLLTNDARMPTGVIAKVGDAMTLTAAYDAAKNAANQASVNAIPTNPLLATNYTAPDNGTIGAISTALSTLAARFTGITSLGNWIRAMTRKSTPDTTALSEINTGGGSFTPVTDSQEAIAEVAGTGGGGGGPTNYDPAKIDQIIQMLNSDPPRATGAQQFASRTIVRGDRYGGGGRGFIVYRKSVAEWPTDLSTRTWSIVFNKAAENLSELGTLAGTVSVGSPTGDSQSLIVTLTTNDDTVAPGRHVYRVVGTVGSDAWSVELGTADVVAGAT